MSGKDVSKELLLRLRNNDYANWIKAGQCLLLLTQGLQPFIDSEMRDFHADLLSQNSLLSRSCKSSCRPSGNKLLGACHFCLEWQKTILAHHRQLQNTCNWDNCSPESWRTNHWEVAKAFMPRGQGNVRRADKFDASALLNLINSCDWFQSVQPNSVREVIRFRNELMHSSDFLVNDEWMKRYESALRILLRQLRTPCMVTAEQQIIQMLRANLSVHVHGLDQTDTDDFVTDSVHDQISPDLISQWEAELIQEKLQELLNGTDQTNSLSTEDLKDLGRFFETNKDLGVRFSSELQSINSKSSQ